MLKKKLVGVNRLLKTIGEPPLLNEDDYQLSSEAELANNQIDETTLEVLTIGFKFNKVYDVEFTPDINGYISELPNAIVTEFEDENITIVEGLVFDAKEYTSVFPKDTALKATVTYNRDFEYIPLVLQSYILAKASYTFQRDTINDPTVGSELKQAELEAFKQFNIWKIKQANANAKDTRFARNANPVAQ